MKHKTYLTLRQKRVFDLYQQGKKQIEIARQLNISQQAVNKLLKKAIKKIELGQNKIYYPRKKVNVSKHCLFCNVDYPLDEHHIIPKKYNGLDVKENIIYLCPNCHRKLHNKILKHLFNLIDTPTPSFPMELQK